MKNKLLALFYPLSFGLFSLLLTLPVKAGDSAILNIIGYSSDNNYFAFEEYGVQDGSGFAYSSIYIIDINEDSWVVGTPIRVFEEDGEAAYETVPVGEKVQKIRAQAFEQAKFRLEGLNINKPALPIAINGDGELNDSGEMNNGLSLQYYLPLDYYESLSEKFTISLETYEAYSPLNCTEYFSQNPMGFLINLTNESGEVREIYRDETLPRSRGCAFHYKIYGVYVPYEATDFSKAIAIISVYAGGFEGLDRRFIAVPIGEE